MYGLWAACSTAALTAGLYTGGIPQKRDQLMHVMWQKALRQGTAQGETACCAQQEEKKGKRQEKASAGAQVYKADGTSQFPAPPSCVRGKKALPSVAERGKELVKNVGVCSDDH